MFKTKFDKILLIISICWNIYILIFAMTHVNYFNAWWIPEIIIMTFVCWCVLKLITLFARALWPF
jgi:hypothetical protein